MEIGGWMSPILEFLPEANPGNPAQRENRANPAQGENRVNPGNPAQRANPAKKAIRANPAQRAKGESKAPPVRTVKLPISVPMETGGSVTVIRVCWQTLVMMIGLFPTGSHSSLVQ